MKKQTQQQRDFDNIAVVDCENEVDELLKELRK